MFRMKNSIPQDLYVHLVSQQGITQNHNTKQRAYDTSHVAEAGYKQSPNVQEILKTGLLSLYQPVSRQKPTNYLNRNKQLLKVH